MRAIHKWVGLVLGLQMFLWMSSGLVMGLLPSDLVAGKHYQRPADPPAAVAWSSDMADWRAPATDDAKEAPAISATLKVFDGRRVYRVVTEAGVYLEDARTGEQIVVDKVLARKLAEADYTGPGKIVGIRLIDEVTLAIRDHQAPVWRIDFDDSESTSLYIAAADGAVLERRNTYWRVFDVAWMLHIMDYQDRDDFNNAIVIIAALLLFWMGITGITLWWDSFRREDFALIANWRARNLRHELEILDSEGSSHQTLSVPSMQTLFQSMADEGYALPSSCGGGGSCGLCRVRIAPDAPVSAADQRQIPEIELTAGYRLACQHRVTNDAIITLPHGLLDARTYHGTIAETRFVTPYICEIRIALPPSESFEFRAGSYVQVEVPPFTSSLEKLTVPDEVRSFWLESGTQTEFGTDATLYRTYSLANSPAELSEELLLNVRLCMPKPDKLGVPVGIGSAYLAGLSVGDPITIKGPLGDFFVRDSADEIIFIGGGAGMAPLRSMIVDQLTSKQSTARTSFWYGARTAGDLLYVEEFESLSAHYDNFTWHVALSDLGEGHSWDGHTGFIHEVLRKQWLDNHSDLGGCQFYVCGPPPMLKAVLEMLEELGVSPDKVAFDDFGI